MIFSFSWHVLSPRRHQRNMSPPLRVVKLSVTRFTCSHIVCHERHPSPEWQVTRVTWHLVSWDTKATRVTIRLVKDVLRHRYRTSPVTHHEELRVTSITYHQRHVLPAWRMTMSRYVITTSWTSCVTIGHNITSMFPRLYSVPLLSFIPDSPAS